VGRRIGVSTGAVDGLREAVVAFADALETIAMAPPSD